ncbi:MAG: hypothetical protein IT428_25355 [Planctomycetaceae bacterium]|nr:hypothetical protein [Planctomycetaceae bacterium]
MPKIAFKIWTGDSIVVDDAPALLTWVSNEREKWNWLEDAPNARPVWDIYREEFSRLERRLREHCRDGWTEGAIQHSIEEIRNVFKSHFLTCSETRLGGFVLELAADESKVPAELGERRHIAAWMLGSRFDEAKFQSAELSAYWRNGKIAATLYELGGLFQTSEKAYLEGLHRKWNDRVEESVEEVSRLRQKVNEVEEAARKQRAGFDAAHEKLSSKHAKRMTEIEDEYTKKLALHAAVTYWEVKAAEHSKNAATWMRRGIYSGIAIVTILAAAVLYEACCGIDAATWIEKVPETHIDILKTTLLHQWAVTAARWAILLGLGVWVARICVRNYLSNVHLESDAMERKTVVNTYLALIRDPDVKDDKELKAQVLPPALQRIFRHSPDGIVKDDANPLQVVIDAVKSKGGEHQ